MSGANLESTILDGAHLEEADLSFASLGGASLVGVHLEGANLKEAHLEGKLMPNDDLEVARKWNRDFPAMLPPANIRHASFDARTNLERITLGSVNPKDGEEYRVVSLADVHWNGVNLAVVNWAPVNRLGDEYEAQQTIEKDGKTKGTPTRLNQYNAAVRANRQLALALQTQGLNEDATRFAYRAQVLQKRVLWFQMTHKGVALRQRMQTLGMWLFSWFLFLLAGYGYKPWRSFLAYLLVIGWFATTYYLLGQAVGPSLSPLGALVFSMTSFHGRGFFPGNNIQLENPLTVLAALEAFVGLIIEVTFIATLTQRLFGK